MRALNEGTAQELFAGEAERVIIEHDKVFVGFTDELPAPAELAGLAAGGEWRVSMVDNIKLAARDRADRFWGFELDVDWLDDHCVLKSSPAVEVYLIQSEGG